MSTTRQSRLTVARKRRLVPQFAAALALVAGSALVLTSGQTANAGIVPTVPLGTAAGYSVLAGSAVTNTGPSVLGRSVGLSPESAAAITGFPPGIVLPPATIQAANGATLQAQIDLTAAYLNAANRPVEFTLDNPDLADQTLLPGVYAAASKAPLGLSGNLVLDAQGNSNAVFIFQTDSTLITSTGSSITLANGALACNVFWQVGSSATLDTGSDFVGTILALTSITLNSDVDVDGRALARNGAVTLINDRFTSLTCDSSPPAAIPTTTAPGATTPGDTTPGATTPGDTTPGATIPATTTPAPVTTFTPTDITLPATGTGSLVTQSGVGFAVLLIGLAALLVARRRQPA